MTRPEVEALAAALRESADLVTAIPNVAIALGIVSASFDPAEFLWMVARDDVHAFHDVLVIGSNGEDMTLVCSCGDVCSTRLIDYVPEQRDGEAS